MYLTTARFQFAGKWYGDIDRSVDVTLPPGFSILVMRSYVKGVAGVPEPGSLSLAVAGLLLVGAKLRKAHLRDRM
jgi:hypothetical protein